MKMVLVSCEDCPLIKRELNNKCGVNGMGISDARFRPSWCPLPLDKEVK